MDDHVSTIMDEGWAVVDNGGSGRPSWSHTVGLWHHKGWPELVICGMDSDWRATLLGQAVLAMEHKQGWSGDVDPELGLLFIRFITVDPGWGATRLLEQSAAFYRSDFPPHWQMVWSDADGNLPGDHGFDERLLEAQPDLAVPWPDHRPGVWPRLGHRP